MTPVAHAYGLKKYITISFVARGAGGLEPPIILKNMQNITFFVLLRPIFAPKMKTALLKRDFGAEVVKEMPLFGPE